MAERKLKLDGEDEEILNAPGTWATRHDSCRLKCWRNPAADVNAVNKKENENIKLYKK